MCACLCGLGGRGSGEVGLKELEARGSGQGYMDVFTSRYASILYRLRIEGWGGSG